MDLSYQKYINGQHDCTKIRQALPGLGRSTQNTSRLSHEYGAMVLEKRTWMVRRRPQGRLSI